MTSRSKTNRAGCWPAVGCRRAWRGSRPCTSWLQSISIRQRSQTRCRWGSRPTVGRGCRPCWQPAMGCLRSTRCRWPVTGNGIPRRGRSQMPRMRICWPRSSGWIGRITAGSPATAEIAEQVKIAARAHQTMIWSRVRQVNTLRSLLREYYPAALAAFGTDLASRDALAVLDRGPSPDQGRRLSQSPDRNPAPACRPAAQHRHDRRQDPDRVEL